MFTINQPVIEAERNADINKNIQPSTRPPIMEAFKSTIWNIIDGVTNYSGTSVYLMSHWILYTDRWITNLNQPEVTTDYKRGSIVFADLGAMNFRFEPSFEHPCIVLVERKNRVLVVPCSSKRYRTPVPFPDCINATRADGFARPTGVQIESIRWIHKNRITKKSGSVRGPLLNVIDQRLLDMTPLYRRTISMNGHLLNDKSRLEAEKASLETDKISLQSAVDLLETTAEERENSINELDAKLKQYKAVVERVRGAIKASPELAGLFTDDETSTLEDAG